MGAFLVIKIGQIDLSMPWAITACAMIGTMAPPDLIIPTILLVGMLIGLVNGIGVAFLRVPSIIFTLGVNSVLLGIVSIITGGFAPNSQASSLMVALGSGRLIPPIPNAALLILAFFCAIAFLLKRSRIGREISAIGYSEGAAYLSGVRTPLVIVCVFMFAGLCYGVGTVLLTGFSGKAFQDMGSPYLMPAIAAVVLGGSSITGGRGNPLAVLVGVMVVVLIQSTLATVQMLPASLIGRLGQAQFSLLCMIRDRLSGSRFSSQSDWRSLCAAACISRIGYGEPCFPARFKMRSRHCRLHPLTSSGMDDPVS